MTPRNNNVTTNGKKHKTNYIGIKTRNDPIHQDMNIFSSSYQAISDVVNSSNLTLKEVFNGTNGKPYEHLYFIGLMNNNINITQKLSDMQKKEISGIEWKTIEECHKLTRPHYIQRTELLNSLERLVKTFNTTSLFINKR